MFINLFTDTHCMAEIAYTDGRAQRAGSEIADRMVEFIRTGNRDALLSGADAGVAATLAPIADEVVRLVQVLTQSLQGTVQNTAQLTEFSSLGMDFQKGFREDIDHLHVFAAAIEEMSGTARDIARNAGGASEVSKVTLESVQEVGSALGSLASEIRVLRTTVGSVKDSVDDFTRQTEAINELTRIIQQIASQTNLLALNAAIEAARAGQHGRGFAVVADEVRKLSEKTNLAVKQIQEASKAITAQSADMSKDISGGVATLNSTIDTLNSMQDLLAESTHNVERTNDRIAEISAAAEEQSSVSADLSRTIHGLAESVRRHQATIEKLLDIAGAIIANNEKARSVMNGVPFDMVVLTLSQADHVVWVKKVADALTGRASLRASDLSDHLSCRLGKWYYGDGGRKYGHLREFRDLEPIHKKVHEVGRRAVEYYQGGDIGRAKAQLEELIGLREQVLALLRVLTADAERA